VPRVADVKSQLAELTEGPQSLLVAESGRQDFLTLRQSILDQALTKCRREDMSLLTGCGKCGLVRMKSGARDSMRTLKHMIAPAAESSLIRE